MALAGRKIDPQEMEARAAAQQEETTTTALEVAAERAVAVNTPAQGRALAMAIANNMLFSDLENGWIPKFGTLPRVKAEQGQIMVGPNSVGGWITGQVMSWNKHWCVSPSDSKAPNELTKFSLDNKTIDDNPDVTVGEYLAELKAAGWPEAKSKEYYEVVLDLTGAERPTETGLLVQLQLSATSVASFNAHRAQMTYGISKGTIKEDEAYFVKFAAYVVPKNAKGHTWTQFVVSKA